MTIPMEIQRASVDFEKFLTRARDEAGLPTRNPAYTMVEGVLHTFRCRLDISEAIRFAGILPPIPRAIFIADWDLSEPKRPFESREVMTREVQSLRKNHNLSPDTAIRDVALALRAHIDEKALDLFLATLSSPARNYWQV